VRILEERLFNRLSADINDINVLIFLKDESKLDIVQPQTYILFPAFTQNDHEGFTPFLWAFVVTLPRPEKRCKRKTRWTGGGGDIYKALRGGRS